MADHQTRDTGSLLSEAPFGAAHRARPSLRRSLAGLIHRHRADIHSRWADIVHDMPESHYRARPLEELRASTATGIEAIERSFATDSYQALENYLREVSLTRLDMGFDIAEVIEALLLFKVPVSSHLAAEFGRDAAQLASALNEVDACVRWIASRFGSLYAHERNRRLQEQQDRTALMLEMAKTVSGSLEMDEVLDRVARGIGGAVGAPGSLVYLWDESAYLFVPRQARSLAGDPASEVLAEMGREPLDPAQDGLARDLFERRESVVAHNHGTDTGPGRETVRRLGLQSLLAVPLIVGDRLLGVALVVSIDQPLTLDQEKVDLALGIANTMALGIENAYAYANARNQLEDTRRKQAIAESLREVLRVLNSGASLHQTLQTIADQASRLLSSPAAAIYHLEQGRSEPLIEASVGLPAGYAEKMTVRLGQGAIGRAITGLKPLAVCDLRDVLPSEVEQASLEEERRALLSELTDQMHSLLAVPMRLHDQIYGGMVLYYRDSREVSPEEQDLAEAFAEQAVLAIETARLRTQAEEAAAAAERSRLARDLHDAVTQTLFSVSLTAEVLPRIWERDQMEGRRRLEDLRQLTRGALAEMRTLLLELRPSALTETDLSDLLRQLTEALISRAGLDVRLLAGGSCALSPEVQVALYRIAQEAMNNIAKHAEASSVEVSLTCEPGEGVSLSIRDDGRGFDRGSISGDSLGLGIMKERAEEIGAALEVDTDPGKGTVEGPQLDELRDFDPVKGHWLLQLDGGRATGSYDVCRHANMGPRTEQRASPAQGRTDRWSLHPIGARLALRTGRQASGRGRGKCVR